VQDLSEAESWVHTVMALPKLTTRFQLLSLSQSFDADVARVRGLAGALSAACTEVRHSTRFARVLEIVLRLGNALNSRQVSGFRLNSLLKLTEVTSTTNRNITLLDYLVLDLERKAQELLPWPEDLPSLAEPGKSIACQESSDPVRMLQTLQALSSAVKGIAAQANITFDIDAEEAVGSQDTSLSDPLECRALAFCEHAREVLREANKAVSDAEAAATSLLEYLAEPVSDSVSSVLTIIGTFASRYNKACKIHAEGSMKNALHRTVSADRLAQNPESRGRSQTLS